jgi:hypothetical protein
MEKRRRAVMKQRESKAGDGSRRSENSGRTRRKTLLRVFACERRGKKMRRLVLESSVRFGFLSIFGKTGTGTGLQNPNWTKNRTATVRDRFTTVFRGLLQLQDQFQPV